MTGERQLSSGSEDPDSAGVGGIAGRQHEGGLREVELPRQLLHRPLVDPSGVGEHRELVAAEGRSVNTSTRKKSNPMD
jgi:hypothetical protein